MDPEPTREKEKIESFTFISLHARRGESKSARGRGRSSEWVRVGEKGQKPRRQPGKWRGGAEIKRRVTMLPSTSSWSSARTSTTLGLREPFVSLGDPRQPPSSSSRSAGCQRAGKGHPWPGPIWGQRQEPHGRQGLGTPGRECRDVRMTDEQLEDKGVLWGRSSGQAFSPGRDHVNRGQEAEHAVRPRRETGRGFGRKELGWSRR